LKKHWKYTVIFYTRPEVKAFESKGGRWVESLGIYNWAFLRPTSATNIALKEFDGKNRFAGKYMAQRGHWMLDMMTAPIQYKEKMERSYPPHGAHGGGRIVPRYCSVYQLADWMQYYDPLLFTFCIEVKSAGVALSLMSPTIVRAFIHLV